MKILKFLTPFILAFPVSMVFAFKTWNGDLGEVGLSPARSILFVAIAFTMLIADLFLKYLVGKKRILYVWLIEAALVGVLCLMILPKINAERLI